MVHGADRRKSGFRIDGEPSPSVSERAPRPIDARPDGDDPKRTAKGFVSPRPVESLGELVGGIAHEINNILMIAGMEADLMLDDLRPDDPLRDRVHSIIEAVDRGSALVRELLALSRRPTADRNPTDKNA